MKAECERQGITLEKYEQLKIEAAAQWYRNDGGIIIIPRHQLSGAIVQVIGSAPKALRGQFDRDNFRALVHIGEFTTDREKADGVFSRFVKLEGSNQRSWQENEFIGCYLGKGEPFNANGVIELPNEKVADTVKALLTAAVESVGVGAAHKMGFGRGVIVTWT